MCLCHVGRLAIPASQHPEMDGMVSCASSRASSFQLASPWPPGPTSPAPFWTYPPYRCWSIELRCELEDAYSKVLQSQGLLIAHWQRLDLRGCSGRLWPSFGEDCWARAGKECIQDTQAAPILESLSNGLIDSRIGNGNSKPSSRGVQDLLDCVSRPVSRTRGDRASQA